MGSPSANEVIVVVDDDEGVRKTFAHMLRAVGYSVLEAVDGDDALRVMSEHGAPVHLVLSDINMPNMDGMEFVGLLRAAYPDIPALLVSGQGTQWMMDNRDRMPENTHFLAKPVSIAGLANKVREILDAAAAD
jgi:CheY-like chemotaxis protein